MSVLSSTRTRLSAAGVFAVVAALALVGTQSPSPARADAAGVDVADAYVRADQAATNFSSATRLYENAGSTTAVNKVSYLKFTVTGLTAPPQSAVLRLYEEVSGSTSITVSGVGDTSWTQSGLTYANRPALGPALGTTGALATGTWGQVNVTSWITGNGTYSFALTTAATADRQVDSSEGAHPPQLVITPTPPGNGDPVVAVGGDIACDPSDANYNGGAGTASACHMRATANLVSAIAPAAVFALGDEQYNSGTSAAFSASYGPSWGAFKSITKPVVGNHEYGTTGAGGYFGYFGAAATPLQPTCTKSCNGWYSFDVGTWHVVALNGECGRLNGGAGCAVGSPQEVWLKGDLAVHPAQCTMVIDHRPYWSSSSFATPEIQPLVADMYAAGVDLIVSGHSHGYERFASQNLSNQSDANGVRQFVVGTGGDNFTGFGTILANSQVHRTNIYGVVTFTLHPGGYDWQFVHDPSTSFTDSGTASCH